MKPFPFSELWLEELAVSDTTALLKLVEDPAVDIVCKSLLGEVIGRMLPPELATEPLLTLSRNDVPLVREGALIGIVLQLNTDFNERFHERLLEMSKQDPFDLLREEAESVLELAPTLEELAETQHEV